jgi:hypothetical protein
MTQAKCKKNHILFNILKGWKIWDVNLRNNYFTGKYSEYSTRPYYIIASSKEEARQVVLNNADAILKDILTKRFPSGRKILSPMGAILISDTSIGRIDDGTKKSRITTLRPKEFFTPDGIKTLQIRDGRIEEETK